MGLRPIGLKAGGLWLASTVRVTLCAQRGYCGDVGGCTPPANPNFRLWTGTLNQSVTSADVSSAD